MNVNPRHTALAVLEESQDKRTTLDKVLEKNDEILDAMTSRDRRLCHALVFGILRNRAFLDSIIRKHSKTPFERLDPKVVHLLRLGLFQIVFMDRVPDFAAINTTIELSKQKGARKASGFINAVLRKAAQNPCLPASCPAKTRAADLAVSHSFPRWLVKKWLAAYGHEACSRLFTTINEIPALTIRVNSLKTDRAALAQALDSSGYRIALTRTSPDGIHILKPGTRIPDLPGFDQGFFQVQDEAAQMVTRILAPRAGESVLDACAGLGGKSFHMAQIMNNKGSILAADTGKQKLSRLEKEAKRLGVTMVTTRQMDILTASVKETGTYFDRVLVDAPCSGLGVMRRNPDTKWKRSPKDLARLGARQKKILNASANLVRPGGVLVYAVCSCETEENQDVIKAFLAKRKDFSPDPTPVSCSFVSQILDSRGFFKTYPQHPYMDGFFAARLVRTKQDG